MYTHIYDSPNRYQNQGIFMVFRDLEPKTGQFLAKNKNVGNKVLSFLFRVDYTV